MARTRTERIAEINAERERLANKAKELLQAQRAQDRKDRTKRLCRRMGLFESLLPETITLTDEQFQSFLEQTVTTGQSRNLLAEMKPQDTAADAQESAGAAKQATDTHAPEPAATAQASGTDEGKGEGNGARVRG
jgi:hypothetical protein